jgi:crotonobetainyl-CoA:carnitine CoA-transferase CaiB-like acyl-CoA transferase
MPEQGPLAGRRVLEVGELVSAPFAAKLLADCGAEVIKVEPPDGDPARRHGPFPGDTPHPERSALFLYLNTSKRSIVLDLTRTEGREHFRRLAAEADLVVENLPRGALAGLGLGYEALAARNPRLSMVSLTPFGQDGPYASYAATNLITLAMGGQMALTGEPDREPLKNAGYQADYQLGLNGFAAAVIALYGARMSGQGQHVDVAAVECMASVLEASLNTYAYTGRRLGTRRGRIRSATIGIYQCADGHLGLHAMPRNLPYLLELIGMPDLLADERFRTSAARLQHRDELMAIFMSWASEQHKKEVYDRAGRMRAPVSYVHNLQDLRDSPQLAARSFWQSIDGLTYPGPPFRMSDSPAHIDRAPPLGEGVGSGEWGVRQEGGDALMPSRHAAHDSPLPTPHSLPLATVRILDLTMVWAGPYGTRILADMGAEVIKVEAGGFYDQIRNLGFLPPGTEAAWNKSAYFNHLNRNKLGCTIDLATERGRALFLDLVATADVVVENYRAEVMDRLGLGYETLRQVKPDIILVSMPGHGKSGPERDYVAYGTNIEQLSGLVSLTGYLDGEPQQTGISYGDPMSGIAMAGAVATALLHRHRTGRGQYVELAQREVLTGVIGEYIVAHSMNGRQPAPLGNHHPSHAPHGVYRCNPHPPAPSPMPSAGIEGPPHACPGVPGTLPSAGSAGGTPQTSEEEGELGAPLSPGGRGAGGEGEEPWVTIACTNDGQFVALCGAMGRPELAHDPRFATEPDRYRSQDELDAIISAWTAGLDKMEVFERLQAVGVPCGPVLSVPELMENPHLRARGFFERVTHPDAGTWDMEGPAYRLSRTPAHIRINGPCFGEHNTYVLGALLGLPDDERSALADAGVTAEQPNMAVHQ